jgi:hypothetical protein
MTYVVIFQHGNRTYTTPPITSTDPHIALKGAEAHVARCLASGCPAHYEPVLG